MADKFNLISGTLTPEQLAKVLDLIGQIRNEMPWLAAMDKDARLHITKPSTDGVDASVAMADAAIAHPDVFAPATSPDPLELKRDAALAKALEGQVLPALAALTQAIEDSALAAKSDAFRNGLAFFATAKAAFSKIPGLEERCRPMTAVLNRPARPKPAK